MRQSVPVRAAVSLNFKFPRSLSALRPKVTPVACLANVPPGSDHAISAGGVNAGGVICRHAGNQRVNPPMPGAVSAPAYYSALVRRFAASPLTRYVILAAGLVGMTALTVPELRASFGLLLNVGLWLCLALLCDGRCRPPQRRTAHRNGASTIWVRRRELLTLSSIVPVPLAFICGLPPQIRLAAGVALGAQAHAGLAGFCAARPRLHC